MSKIQQLSIIMPVFNAQEWIGPTTDQLSRALEYSSFAAELIIVDDGSTDNTFKNAVSLKPSTKKLKIRVISQENKGRYLARKTGVEAARYNHIMFIDSRVFIQKNAFKFLATRLQNSMDQVWNAHVNVDKEGNIFARFWDAIVSIAWRKYFKNPRETTYGIKDFDYFPKGTTMLYAPKKLMQEAMDDFSKHSNGSKYANDDTLLIRFIAERIPIHIAPQFSCVYHSRSTLKTFLKHAYHRGQVFTDGFLRPGNRFFIPLIGVLILCVGILVGIVIEPVLFLTLSVTALTLGSISLLFGGLILGLEWQDSLSLAILSPLFVIFYGSGIWLGVFRKFFIYMQK